MYLTLGIYEQLQILEQEIKMWEAKHFQLMSRAKAEQENKQNEKVVAQIMAEAEYALKVAGVLKQQAEEIQNPQINTKKG